MLHRPPFLSAGRFGRSQARLLVAALTVTSLGACSMGPVEDRAPSAPVPRTASILDGENEPEPLGRLGLEVQKSGFVFLGNRFSAAALLRNRSRQYASDIRLRLTFYDEEKNVVARQKENLPYCPPRSRCWWSTIYPGNQVARDWESTSDLQIDVIGGSRIKGKPDLVREFPVARADDGTVRGIAPKARGIVYIIGLEDGTPRSGIAVNVAVNSGLPRRFAVPEEIFPMFGGEQLKAVMYTVSFDVFGH